MRTLLNILFWNVCVLDFIHILDKRNTLWLRDTVRQTSRGKSADAGLNAGRPRLLTSRGMSAWPYRVTTKYSYYIKEIVTGSPNDPKHQNSAHPKHSPIDCDGVLLTNVQCHMVPISILWYRKYWNIQLKCTLETRQERITVSNHSIHQHGQTNFWYVCLLEGLHLNY